MKTQFTYLLESRLPLGYADELVTAWLDTDTAAQVHLVNGNPWWRVWDSEHEEDNEPCEECARSFGPHYSGKCTH